MAETIQPASIVEETRRRYLNYALSVITSRALPDVRDGLKPVQRRILYTMYHDLHLHADGRPRKCSKIVGDVMGNYHPHGDVAIYEALVRLAQDWVMRFRLVDGQGNFGSVDGDPPAALRYTEAKLTALADELMSELRQRTVDMRPNYEGTREEPVVLPAQFPQPAGQRHVRHRRRHGHQHSAAQPRRSHQGGDHPHRRTRRRPRHPSRPHQGTRLSPGRQGRHRPADPAQDLRGRAPAASRSRASGSWKKWASASRSSSRRSPTASTRATWRRPSARSSPPASCRS